MAVVKLEHLEAGMVLDHDVKDLSGRMLLRSGAEITPKHLKIFRSWGVSEAHVRGVGEAPPAAGPDLAELDPVLVARVEGALRAAFAFHDLDEPVTRELFAVALDHRLRREARNR